MGLNIKCNKSKKSISWSYRTLHYIRWLALISCGLPEKIADQDTVSIFNSFYFAPNEKYPTPEEMRKFLWAYQQSGYFFPNLMFHSDCEGSYTKNDEIFKNDKLKSGNSIKLLKELKLLKTLLPEKYKIEEPCTSWHSLCEFYDLINYSIENGDGKIIFS